MITKIDIPHAPDKTNWIDQNNIVFGFDTYAQCCETFGYAVYDPATRKKVDDSPAGLPYHFGFASGARTEKSPNFQPFYSLGPNGSQSDDERNFVQITLLPDSSDTHKPLVLECFNFHNGFYFHDFSLTKQDPA